MKKVVVIGGGLAGLSAAVHLASVKIPVTVLESASRLGGRVSSFHDSQFNTQLDNGQHIMMGCYNETLRLIKLINAQDNFYFQKNLEIIFYNSGKAYPLDANKGFFPFNLVKSLLSFKLLKPVDRFNLLGFITMLPLSSSRDTINMNALGWLKQHKQGEQLRKIFWNTFIIGAMNTSPEKASAFLLRDILLKVFFSGRNSSVIIIPSKPLTEAFCTPAEDFLKKSGSEIVCSERVLSLEKDRSKNKITKIFTNKRIIKDFSNVISAVPLYSLNKILKYDIAGDFRPHYSPILSVHFKSEKVLFSERFIAVTDSPIHWIFKHPEHYTIVISNADDLLILSNEELTNLIIKELKNQFSVSENDIKNLRIIKERRATFTPSADLLFTRPQSRTDFNNLFLAGDWTNTGLPATIEGAVLSGRKAAGEISFS
jgi:hydroxysqualene dehydroxylase